MSIYILQIFAEYISTSKAFIHYFSGSALSVVIYSPILGKAQYFRSFGFNNLDIGSENLGQGWQSKQPHPQPPFIHSTAPKKLNAQCPSLCAEFLLSVTIVTSLYQHRMPLESTITQL